MRGRDVLRDGAKVGTIDRQGRYRLTDERGQVHTGSVGALMRRAVRERLTGGAAGPTGRLRFDGQVYEVRGGAAFRAGEKVGTVSPMGEFAVQHGAVTGRGHVLTTIGAVWLGAAESAPGSGTVEVGGRAFRAVHGRIYVNGEEIGWLTAAGHFRGVTAEGDFFAGRLGGRTLYLRRH